MAHWRLLLVILLGWPWLAGAGVTALPPGARLIAADQAGPASAAVAAGLAPVRAELARGDAAAAMALLHAIEDPLRREAIAVAAIDELQTLPATPAADEFLAQLALEPVLVYRRHEETLGNWFVPVYDVPGRAQSARRLLARLAARDRLLPALRAGDPAALRSKSSDVAVLAAAIEQLTPEQADRLLQRAVREGGELPSAAWAALAWRAPSPLALDAVIRRADPVDALPLLQQLPPRLKAAQALPWLEQALQRPEYRSVAVSGIGVLAASDAGAEARLVELLGAADPDIGTSAAAALARLDVPDRLQRIDALLERKSGVALARLALALRLEDSPGARARLERLAQDARLPAALRKELQR